MSQTRPNGITVPTNPDNFQNLPNDLATMADSANVVIAVASQAARDALTKKAGLTVTRTDLPGSPIETCDGTNWATQQVPKVWANSILVGSPSNPLSSLQSGGFVPIIQCGTVVATTDGSGNVTITFPQAFPNALITTMAWSGDGGVGNYLVAATPSTVAQPNLGAFYANVKNTSGANITNTGIRFNWIAVGI